RAGVAVFAAGLALSVTAQELKPSFEVASIKPNKAGPVVNSVAGVTAGGYMMRNGWIEMLITTAYPHINRTEILGAPESINSERCDINATAGRQTRSAEVQAMLRALLVERFQFVAHEESRDRPAYALKLARADGRLGPDLRRSTLDCAAIAAAKSAGRPTPQL